MIIFNDNSIYKTEKKLYNIKIKSQQVESLVKCLCSVNIA